MPKSCKKSAFLFGQTKSVNKVTLLELTITMFVQELVKEAKTLVK